MENAQPQLTLPDDQRVRELEQRVWRLESENAGLREQLADVVPEDLSIDAAEKMAIIRAMKAAHGNKRQACRVLKIGKTTLYRKLEMYGIRYEPQELH